MQPPRTLAVLSLRPLRCASVRALALHPYAGQLVRVHAATSVLARRLELQPVGVGVLVHSYAMAVEGAHAREVAATGAGGGAGYEVP